MIRIDPKFEIGQKVYYNLPEGEVGLVTEIEYLLSSGLIWYHVSFGPRAAIACLDFELSTEKKVI